MARADQLTKGTRFVVIGDAYGVPFGLSGRRGTVVRKPRELDPTKPILSQPSSSFVGQIDGEATTTFMWPDQVEVLDAVELLAELSGSVVQPEQPQPPP